MRANVLGYQKEPGEWDKQWVCRGTMSTLNLEPNPVYMAAQLVVLALNFIIVKKLFVAPYLRLLAARRKETEDKGVEAERLKKDCSEKERDLNARIKDLQINLQREFETASLQASKDQEAAADLTRKEIDNRRKKIQIEIKNHIEQEKKKTKGEISKLTQTFFQRILG